MLLAVTAYGLFFSVLNRRMKGTAAPTYDGHPDVVVIVVLSGSTFSLYATLRPPMAPAPKSITN